MKISMRSARVNAKLTQAEAARRIGVGRATLAAWEKGICFPSAPAYLAMCDLYGVGYRDIFLVKDLT